jgi:hypothetical protein
MFLFLFNDVPLPLQRGSITNTAPSGGGVAGVDCAVLFAFVHPERIGSRANHILILCDRVNAQIFARVACCGRSGGLQICAACGILRAGARRRLDFQNLTEPFAKC